MTLLIRIVFGLVSALGLEATHSFEYKRYCLIWGLSLLYSAMLPDEFIRRRLDRKNVLAINDLRLLWEEVLYSEGGRILVFQEVETSVRQIFNREEENAYLSLVSSSNWSGAR
ncbi:hypothetical protein B0T26DRAFT_349219 [Lasiosphaeria miniovina]|uniref:Uncharacterized protein n=1 Tax=Lasiosphaeria miniovina TaxID=1954250 RepID=A0AA40ABT7_9PEZI|nr:uncharacterized protein B0T26DRAFT_349219 [Lasiosphaeria miniovina]KAK0712937.1 hypothetical protein B0T26DRAFT_349219 [Lasiosphaeria miniovina]